jgi:hypothetical protein
MGTLMALWLLAAAAAPSVEYDPQVDFSQYHTWSWHKGATPAANLVAEKRIRDSIEKALSARGLSRTEGTGALLVLYRASKTTDIALAPIGTTAPTTPTGIRYVEKGSLVVEMLDAASRNVVWRGHVAGALKYGPSEIGEQVQDAVAALLERFPPPPRP